MDQLMFALMAWISAVTGLPPATDTPDVQFNTVAELQVLHSPDASYQAESSAPQAIALYNLHEAVIHLPDDWQPTDPLDVSVLVHELVHHMQVSAGEEYRCRAAMEKVAYDTQIAFLASMGIDLFEAMEINELFYRIITDCDLMGSY